MHPVHPASDCPAQSLLRAGVLAWQVPPTLRFVLEGEMPSFLLAKDLILQVIGEITVAGGTYKAMEFTGPVVNAMTMEDRMTLCNMVVEAGGKNGARPAIRPSLGLVCLVAGISESQYSPVEIGLCVFPL